MFKARKNKKYIFSLLDHLCVREFDGSPILLLGSISTGALMHHLKTFDGICLPKDQFINIVNKWADLRIHGNKKVLHNWGKMLGVKKGFFMSYKKYREKLRQSFTKSHIKP